jgi:hypothetical protein
MIAYQNYNQSNTIYLGYYDNYYRPPLPKACLTQRQQQQRMQALQPFKQNKGDVVLVPPVRLIDCTKEPWPLPPVVRLATHDWCARRLAARRRHLPLRSRPGARW